MGTLVAWVLVRDEFPGQALRQLADRPAVRAADDRRRADAARAVRAATARSASTSPTRGARSCSRCCSSRCRSSCARCSRCCSSSTRRSRRRRHRSAPRTLTTFRRIVLPSLRPAILSGAALAFARAVGEIGSLVLIAGKVQIASIVIFADIESDAPQAAASLSVVLLVISLIVLVALRALGRPGCALAAEPRCRCGRRARCTWRCCCCCRSASCSCGRSSTASASPGTG